MKIERLTVKNDKYLKAIDLYNNSFPLNEQRNFAGQLKVLKNEEYYFNILNDEDDFVGIMLNWETENFIYIEHFSILPSMRNKKYGQKALELLQKKDKMIILEIDPPIDEISKRRLNFYERVGFKTNSFKHFHPPYHKIYPPHELIIMSYPKLLTDDGYDVFFKYLKDVVMK